MANPDAAENKTVKRTPDKRGKGRSKPAVKALDPVKKPAAPAADPGRE